MLRKRVTSEIKRRFPEVEIEFEGLEPNVIAVIPPIHGSWKPIVIYDDISEVTVYFGQFTHSHYKYYGEAQSLEAKAKSVAEDLCDDLAMVFCDKMEFYRSESSSEMGPIESEFSRARRGFPITLWSGKTVPQRP